MQNNEDIQELKEMFRNLDIRMNVLYKMVDEIEQRLYKAKKEL